MIGSVGRWVGVSVGRACGQKREWVGVEMGFRIFYMD